MPAFIHHHPPHIADLDNCPGCINRAAHYAAAGNHCATGAHLLHTGDNSTLADDYARHLARDHTELHLTGTPTQLDRFHDDHGGCWYHIDRHPPTPERL